MVGEGGVELEGGRSFPLKAGFTPIIGPYAHLSTTFGWVGGGECSLGGTACLDDRIGSWGDGTSVIGGSGGRSRLVGEHLGGGGVGKMGLEETPEDFKGWELAMFECISVPDMGTGCLWFLTMAPVSLARFGFLARSLVGCNAAEQT